MPRGIFRKGAGIPQETFPLTEGIRRRSFLWHLGIVWAGLILGLVGEIPPAQARLLNIGGSLSINYSRSTGYLVSDAATTRDTIHSLGEQYGLVLSGDLYNLGDYNGGITWTQQTFSLEGRNQKSRVTIKEYRLGVNLFPQWSPLGLTRQRNIRKSDAEFRNQSISTWDRVDTFGANWVLNLRRVPKTNLSYQESKLTTKGGGNLTTRSASANTDGVLGVTRIAFGYQFSETDSSSSSPSRSHGLNLDTISQLTTDLTLSAYGRYSTSHSPVATAPGVSVFQERSLGLSLVYRPHLNWWDGSTAYNYTESPFFNNFRSHSLQGLANLRYNINTDSAFGARYLRFTVVDASVDSEGVDASLNYRPIFGLSTTASGGYSNTATHPADTESTRSFFQTYRYLVNYARPFQKIQYRAGYQLSYGLSDTQPVGSSSRDLGNSVNFGMDNTEVQVLHVGFNSIYSNFQRVSESVKTEQSTYLLQVSADSSYFKSLIFRGDALNLRSQANYSNTTGAGLQGRVISGEFLGDYQTHVGFSFSEGYRIEKYPNELLLDRQIFSTTMGYTTRLPFNASLVISLTDIEEDNRYRDDINRAQGNIGLDYQIGLLTMGIQIMEIDTFSAGNRYGSRSISGRASRSF